MPRPTVYLFDIDGTLVSTGGAGRRAMQRAFEVCVGRHDLDFSFAGMTDPAILRRGLDALSVAVTDEALDALSAAYLDALADELPRSPSFVVHRGVVETLDRLARRAATALGLGTGNYERGARLKLDVPGLTHRFGFGGYGSDHEDRAELVRIGIARGAASLGLGLRDVRAVVIGDTERDVAAAEAAGAECLAVSNGATPVETLARAGATRAVQDLEAPGVVEFLEGAS